VKKVSQKTDYWVNKKSRKKYNIGQQYDGGK